MKRMENKVAIITGASMGLGEADARAFAREGLRSGSLTLTQKKVRNWPTILVKMPVS